jgi:hypothetical protein
MRTFARLTSIAFMILGVLVILVGLYVALSGLLQPAVQAQSFYGILPDFSGLLVFARVFAGSVVGLGGLFLAALGQVLWLLASISDQTEKTSEHMSELIRRIGQPKP